MQLLTHDAFSEVFNCHDHVRLCRIFSLLRFIYNVVVIINDHLLGPFVPSRVLFIVT